MTAVLSYGGGVQSVAMCVLVATGKLPRPDRIVIADTGREAQSTWDYHAEHVEPLLADVGLAVERAPHWLATVDLYAGNGDLLLPVFTATGKLQTFCSNEWKTRVMHRYLTDCKVRPATIWLGFTLDERQRAKQLPGPYPRSFPLLDLMLTRSDCERIITDAGLPVPLKSACFMCPHRSNEEWRAIRGTPQWAEAIAIDEDARLADQRGGVFLHRSLVPLAEADIDSPDRAEPSRQCGLGGCWT